MKFIAKNEDDLEKISNEIFKSILMKMALEKRTGKDYGATVVGLYGDLGAGKTTFTKKFAKNFGLNQKEIISPTFVLQKRFKIDKDKKIPFKNFYHLDVYRIDSPNEILSIGWEKIIKDPKNIILIEWASKIEEILPNDTLEIKFEIVDEETREIRIDSKD